MNAFFNMLIPVCICAVLPGFVVFVVFRFLTLVNKRRSDIILEAIRQNPNIDTQELIKAFQSKQYSVWTSLSRKLLRGCIFTLMGAVLIIIGCCVPLNYDSIGLLIVGGCVASVGIGFLITYLFVYKNKDNFQRENDHHIG